MAPRGSSEVGWKKRPGTRSWMTLKGRKLIRFLEKKKSYYLSKHFG